MGRPMRVFLAIVAIGLMSASSRAEDHWAYLPPVAAADGAGVHPVDARLADAWETGLLLSQD